MRVLVVGGGIAGLTLAWWLQRSAHTPVVVEKAPRLRDLLTQTTAWPLAAPLVRRRFTFGASKL